MRRPSLGYGARMTAFATALAACSTGRTTTYVAPSNTTVVGQLEVTNEGNGHHVYIENRSTVPVVVTSVRLTECENVRPRCDVLRLRRRLAPGTRDRVLTVRQDHPARSYTFRWSYTWEPEGSAAAAILPGIIDTAVTPVAPIYLPAPIRGRPLAVGLDSLVMIVGERVSFPSVSADSLGAGVAVTDETIAAVTGGRELFALKAGRTDVVIRVAGGLVRMPLIVRSAAADSGVTDLTVRPDSLVLRVGEKVEVSKALTVEATRATGQVVPVTGWSLYVEDPSTLLLGTGEVIGRRPGRTAIVLEVRGARARVPVVVVP